MAIETPTLLFVDRYEELDNVRTEVSVGSRGYVISEGKWYILKEANGFNTWLLLAARGQLKPEFANSIDECTNENLLYVLPDGYIYAYMRKHIVQKTNEYNASTAKLNTRINSSGEEKELAGCLTTDFVEVSLANPYIVNISGVTLNLGYGTYVSINYYNASKTWLGVKKIEDINYSPDIYDEAYANAAYVRLQLGIKTEIAITEADVADLFIEFVPKTIDEEVTGWHSTGHAFVPADYEDRIVALEENVANLKENDAESESITLPSYWQTAADEAVAKVKAIQDEGGNNIFNFVWFSDMHYDPTNSHRYTKNIGKLCAYVMDACNIPLCVMCGDTMSADSVAQESTLLAWLEDANRVLAPIGKDRLLRVKGNHDDVYGSYTDGNTTTYYVNKVAPAKIHNRIFRSQGEDFRRVFGSDGSYFYIDTPQRLRIICLNTHFYDGEEITDGTVGASSFGFGEEQLNWLRDYAISNDETVNKAVIVMHVPPTEEVINGRDYYLSLLSDGTNFRNVLSNALQTGGIPVQAIFCGHAHADANVTDMNIPIITITCANNTSYDESEAARDPGTTTETALDIVSINTATGVIKTTRLGLGNDRVINNDSQEPPENEYE